MSEEALWDAVTVGVSLGVVVLYGLHRMRTKNGEDRGLGMIFLILGVALLGGFLLYSIG